MTKQQRQCIRQVHNGIKTEIDASQELNLSTDEIQILLEKYTKGKDLRQGIYDTLLAFDLVLLELFSRLFP